MAGIRDEYVGLVFELVVWHKGARMVGRMAVASARAVHCCRRPRFLLGLFVAIAEGRPCCALR
jgi:hypothetical protein